MCPFLFPKNERLLNSKDFVNLNRLGKRFHAGHFTLILAENGLGISRLGITVSRKIGNAVTRNRAKRFIREFYRHHKDSFPQGYDIIVAARKGAGNLDLRKISEELGALVRDKKFHVSS